jgi:hypothetical protein
MNILSLFNTISYCILILCAYKDFLATFILYICNIQVVRQWDTKFGCIICMHDMVYIYVVQSTRGIIVI